MGWGSAPLSRDNFDDLLPVPELELHDSTCRLELDRLLAMMKPFKEFRRRRTLSTPFARLVPGLILFATVDLLRSDLDRMEFAPGGGS